MAFLHPVRHLPKFHTELLILVSVLLLLLLSILIIHATNTEPRLRTVPQPVVAGEKQETPVHFSKLQGNTSVTVPAPRAPITARTSTTSLESALTQLLKGPTATEKANGYYSEIPAGTKLLDVQVSGKTVTVDLSKEFTTGGGSTSMLQRVRELKNTVHGVTGNDRTVKIAIEGKPLHVLGGEGLELD